MKPKLQKYILVKHILAASVEEAIKKQHSAPVIHAYIEQTEPIEGKQIGF